MDMMLTMRERLIDEAVKNVSGNIFVAMKKGNVPPGTRVSLTAKTIRSEFRRINKSLSDEII